MVILVVFRCVCLRVSLCVLVVTDVSVSPSMVSVLGEMFVRLPRVNLLNRSPFLSLESDVRSFLKVREA